MTDRPDVFTHVHQGIRRALFDASTALARAEGDPAAQRVALSLVDDALLFVTRHGENEDTLLLPLLDARAPEISARMRIAHQRMEGELETIRELHARRASDLYLRLSLFIAHYLTHMAEEELELEAHIRTVVSDAELIEVGKQAVARVDPGERMRMLRLMIPALPLAAARSLFERMPPDVAQKLASVDDRFPRGQTP